MAARKEQPVRAYLLWGQEELRKREMLGELLDSLVPPEDRELDVQYIDATNANVTGEFILRAVRDRAMFSEQRVVVVLGAGRLRAPRHQRTQETLAAGLPGLPDYATLILLAYAEDSDDRRGRAPLGEKLMASFRAHGKVVQFALLKPDELAALAVKEAKAAGKQLTAPAAKMLADRAGPDSQRVLQETRKLIAYAGERPNITPQDVGAMVAAPPDDNIFHMLDATMNGDQRRALHVLRDLLASGSAPLQIMPMLARTIRNIAQAKLLLERRVTRNADAADLPPEVAALLPREASFYKTTKPGFGRDKLWEQAGRMTWAQLQRALDRLAVAEAGTKGWEHGAEDPELALELFIAALSVGVRSASGGGGRSNSGWTRR